MDRQLTEYRRLADPPVDPAAERLEEEFWGHEPRRRSLRMPRPTQRPRLSLRVRPRDEETDVLGSAAAMVEPRPAVAIDPILRRAGLLGLVVALLVPVALAFRSERAPLIGFGDATVAYGADAAATSARSAATTPAGEVDYPMVGPISPSGLPLLTAPGATSATDSSSSGDSPARRTDNTPTSVTCASHYEVRSGDSWSHIASRASITLDRLLAANSATTSTVILVGQDICLPPEAKVSALTSSGSASSAAAKTSVSAPPTTLAPPPPNNYSRDQVIGIIREVWPDDLEDTAIMIADRESHLNPSAQNWCCVGLFQIYWNVHKGWLAAIGITDRGQMFDPRNAARAGYALYQRSNSFRPWGL